MHEHALLRTRQAHVVLTFIVITLPVILILGGYFVVRSPAPVATIPNGMAFAFHPDGTLLVIPNPWDVPPASLVPRPTTILSTTHLMIADSSVSLLADPPLLVSPDGTWVVVRKKGCVLEIYRAPTWQRHQRIDLRPPHVVAERCYLYGIDVSPDGQMVAFTQSTSEPSSRMTGVVVVTESQQPPIITRLPQPEPFSQIAFTVNGQQVVIAGEGLEMRNWRENRLDYRFPERVYDVAMDRNRERMVVLEDARIVVRQVQDGTQLQVIEPLPATPMSSFAALALSPDGHYVAISGLSITGFSIPVPITIWRTDTGARVQRLPGYIQGTDQLTFSPDGKSLVVRNPAGNIDVWQVEAPALGGVWGFIIGGFVLWCAALWQWWGGRAGSPTAEHRA
jgi:WD40 repeat protein